MHAAACLRAQNGAASRNTSSRSAALPRSPQPRFDVMQHSTASYSTARRGTAQHGIAQQFVAPGSTAQHGAAPLRRHAALRGIAQHRACSTAPHGIALRIAAFSSPPIIARLTFIFLTQHRRCCRHLRRSPTGPCLLAFGGHLHTHKSVRSRALDDALRRARCMHLCACVLH